MLSSENSKHGRKGVTMRENEFGELATRAKRIWRSAMDDFLAIETLRAINF
jgi:hypothetical protein